jgi:hypothetical protein
LDEQTPGACSVDTVTVTSSWTSALKLHLTFLEQASRNSEINSSRQNVDEYVPNDPRIECKYKANTRFPDLDLANGMRRRQHVWLGTWVVC